jgi:hypothetical protein
MADTPVRWRERVLIARRPPTPGAPLTGTAVSRSLTPAGEAVYTIILDAPARDGRAIIDCFESQLVVLAVPDRR